VTTSVTLATDLTCPHDGLIVTGSHITVNLNGHTITGPSGGSLTTGIYVSGASTTIQNGRVGGFRSGVYLVAAGDRAQNVHVVANSFGIQATGDNVLVTGNFVSGNGSIGITGGTGAHIQITNNWVRANSRGIL